MLAVVQVERPTALIETDYGRVLLAKLGLVALVLGLAAFNRWRLTSQVGAGPAGRRARHGAASSPSSSR